jgi:small subunit ribosomal protein S11
LTNKGEVISWSSTGKMGFRGSKKNTPYTKWQQRTVVSIIEAGLKKVKVYVGVRNGRGVCYPIFTQWWN